MPKQRHRRVRIEDAIQLIHGLDPKDVTRAHGRLVLGTDGLFFIHGWDERRDDSVGGTSGMQDLGLLGVAVVAAVNAVMVYAKKRANRWSEDAKQDGLRMLDEVRELAPKRQVARIAGSTHVPIDDIERVTLGWVKGLRVVTAARGDEHRFLVPRSGRKATKAWIAAVRGRKTASGR